MADRQSSFVRSFVRCSFVVHSLFVRCRRRSLSLPIIRSFVRSFVRSTFRFLSALLLSVRRRSFVRFFVRLRPPSFVVRSSAFPSLPLHRLNDSFVLSFIHSFIDNALNFQTKPRVVTSGSFAVTPDNNNDNNMAACHRPPARPPARP